MPRMENDDAQSVMLSSMPKAKDEYDNPELAEKWDKIIAVRNDVNKALEPARNEKIIGKSLDAEVTVYADGEIYDILSGMEAELAEIFITSKAEVCPKAAAQNATEGDVCKVAVRASEHPKCGRCWVHSETVGTIEGFDGICADCVRKLTK